MLNFEQWATEKKLNLDADVQPAVEGGSKKADKTENTKRTGYSANYPPAYVSGQYPDLYFPPIKATAPLDKEIMDKKQVKKA